MGIRHFCYTDQPAEVIELPELDAVRVDVHRMRNCFLQINKTPIIQLNLEGHSFQFASRKMAECPIKYISIHPDDPKELMSIELIVSSINFGGQLIRQSGPFYQAALQHVVIDDNCISKAYKFNYGICAWLRQRTAIPIKTLMIVKAQNALLYIDCTFMGPLQLHPGFQINTDFAVIQSKPKDPKLLFHFEALIVCGSVFPIKYKPSDILYELHSSSKIRNTTNYSDL